MVLDFGGGGGPRKPALTALVWDSLAFAAGDAPVGLADKDGQ